jgi:hypothetical protein
MKLNGNGKTPAEVYSPQPGLGNGNGLKLVVESKN